VHIKKGDWNKKKIPLLGEMEYVKLWTKTFRATGAVFFDSTWIVTEAFNLFETRRLFYSLHYTPRLIVTVGGDR
jgi:hypothetical protein